MFIKSTRCNKLLLIITILLLIQITSCVSRAGEFELDRESIECLNCHKDDYPFDKADCFTEGCTHHPMGIDYQAAASRNPGLKEESSLNPAIRLIDKRIGCGTCHIPYSEDNHLVLSESRGDIPSISDPMLVMDNRKSALCKACHTK